MNTRFYAVMVLLFAGFAARGAAEDFILIEAESFASAERTVAVIADDGASGGFAVDIVPRSRAFYRVDLPESGVWYVWVRMFAPLESSDSCWVGSDAAVPYPLDNSNPHPALRFYASPGDSLRGDSVWGLWYWDAGRANSDPASRLTFRTAGSVTLWIKGREAGTLVDAVLLTQDPAFNPERADPAAVPVRDPDGAGGGEDGEATPAQAPASERERIAPGTELPLYGRVIQPQNTDASGQTVRRGTIEPSLTAFIPEECTGTAVILVPGGGYTQIQYDVEGVQIAGRLNALGIAAFVLSYRLPPGGNRSLNGDAVDDTLAALRFVHERAARWGIDSGRIGVAGFSAGGHLVLSAVSAGLSGAGGPGGSNASGGSGAAAGSDARPDFIALVYPSVPDPAPVDASLPPVFFAVSAMDTYVSAERIVEYYTLLARAGVSAELHVFGVGSHGFGARETGYNIDAWLDLFAGWLRDHRLLELMRD